MTKLEQLADLMVKANALVHAMEDFEANGGIPESPWDAEQENWREQTQQVEGVIDNVIGMVNDVLKNI